MFRPEGKRHEPWIERCRTQMHGALAELDRIARALTREWMIGGRLTQADVTTACVFGFLCDALTMSQPAAIYPGLAAHGARCEALPEFRSVKADLTHPVI